MLKKLISISLCAFMLFTMMFSAGVSAADSTAVNEITAAVFTDDLTSMDYMYSYPSAADNWHLEQLSEFKFEGAGTAITAVGYKCGDANDNWVIPNWCNFFYKAGEKDGCDKKFTKAEFTVWINNDTYAAGRIPVIKIKDSENSAVYNAENVVWTKTTNAQKKYDWNCQITGTVTFDKGAEFVGIGFDTDTTTIAKSVTARYFYLDKVVLSTGAEADKYYGDGSTLENAWSYNNLQVIDDVVGNANYNNGGKMIGLVEANYKASDVVYKVPEGRNFKSFFAEVSMQNLTDAAYPVISYSEDGKTYINFDFTWTVGSAPGSGQNNAGWARKYTAKVTAPESADVKFVKLSHSGAAMNSTSKLYIRKTQMLTEGNVVAENITDSLSGKDAALYEISNFTAYDLLNKDEAKSIATETGFYGDADLLSVDKLDADAYIVYKAADGKVFTDFEVKFLTRDNGDNNVDIKIFASKDGDVYDEITANVTDSGFISSTSVETVPNGAWNRLRMATGTMEKADGYTYIKLFQPANAVKDSYGYVNAKCFKLANVALSVKNSLENTTVAPGFVESFASTDNLADFKGVGSSTEETRFRVKKDYVGSTEPAYVVYKIADGKNFGKVKIVFTETDIYSPDYIKILALDADKNVIEWDNSALWSEFTYKSGNTFHEFILYGDVPQNAKYLKLQVNYTDDNWRCVIDDVKIYGPEFDDSYKCAIYSVDGEGAETDLNGTLANGNLKAKVSFTNVDLGDKTVYAVAALKDGGKVVKAELSSYTLTEDGETILDTPVLTGCETGENVSLEVYLFDVTDGKLTPVANFVY